MSLKSINRLATSQFGKLQLRMGIHTVPTYQDVKIHFFFFMCDGLKFRSSFIRTDTWFLSCQGCNMECQFARLYSLYIYTFESSSSFSNIFLDINFYKSANHQTIYHWQIIQAPKLSSHLNTFYPL